MKLTVKDYVIEGSLEEIISAIFAIDKRFRDQTVPAVKADEPAKIYKIEGSKATKDMHVDNTKVVSYEEQFHKILFAYPPNRAGAIANNSRIANAMFDRKPHIAKEILFSAKVGWSHKNLAKVIRYLKKAGCKFEIQNRDSNDILSKTDKSIYPNTVIRLTAFGTLAQAKAARKERSEKNRMYTDRYNKNLAKKKNKTAVKKQPVSSEVVQLLNQ